MNSVKKISRGARLSSIVAAVNVSLPTLCLSVVNFVVRRFANG